MNTINKQMSSQHTYLYLFPFRNKNDEIKMMSNRPASKMIFKP